MRLLYKEFNDSKVRFFSILLVTIALFFFVAPFQKYAVTMISESAQDPVLQKMGITEQFIQKLKDWNFYIFSQWFGKNFGQMIPILAIIMGFPLIARERENETLDFVLTRVSRKEVFFTKAFFCMVLLAGIITVGSFLPSIYSLFLGKEIMNEYAFKFYVHTLVSSIFWYTVSVFFSVIFNDQVKPLLASFGLLAVTTTLGLLKPLSFLNTYKYVLGYNIFEKGNIDVKMTVGLLIISAVILVVSERLFENLEV